MVSDDLLPTRHSLVRRLKDWDDQRSWDDFFNTYWRLIYGVAIKAGLTETEAQDVVQETVMTVAKNIKNFQVGPERGSFKAWLLQTTRWRIADQFRKRPEAVSTAGARRTEETSRTATIERVPDPATLDLETVWEEEWKQTLAEAALEKLKTQLDPEQYQMFDLHVLKDWPAGKVAAKLGVKLGKVYFAKYKVSRLFRKEIRRLEAKGI